MDFLDQEDFFVLSDVRERTRSVYFSYTELTWIKLNLCNDDLWHTEHPDKKLVTSTIKTSL